ncbi:hypothetical protein [Nocardia cyriacigeorgica]|uniref:hypothetical protein n=1 Tax=Nocardia cyriacigeorgica TaxID=135487 RepID=UPI0034DB6EA1
MSDQGTTEEARTVPADRPMREFGAIKFEGGRYDDHPGFPIFAMAELQRYAKLVSSVAHALYMEQNPERQRVPQGFADTLDLRLVRVDRGSVVPVLEWSAPEQEVMGFVDVYDDARELIDETFREIAESGRIPSSFPAKAIGNLAQFGRSLRDGESIVLGRNPDRPSVVNGPVRERLGELANLDTIDVERVFIGRITGLRSQPQHQFDLVLAGPEKKRMDGTFVDPAMFDLLEEFMGYAGTAPLCSISVLGQRQFNGELTVTDVLAIEAALPPDWASRVAELAEIRDGWLETTTRAPTVESIDLLEVLLAKCVDAGVPRPLMFPSGEGGIQLEWRERAATVEVEIFNDKSVEAVWFDPDSVAGAEMEYSFTDVDAIVEFVTGAVQR